MSVPDGSHDQLLDAATAGLPVADRGRFVGEFGLLLAELGRCPAVSGPVDDDDPDPPLRWSPWMRGRLRCTDHDGHIQSRLRLRAQRAKDAGDPVWPAWLALAEHQRLAELVRCLDPDRHPDGVS